MNKGVQILLERMESNPDEFKLNDVLSPNKWANIIINIRARMQKMASKSTELNTIDELSFLTDEEVLALDAKLKDVRRDAFTQDIMAKLLANADDGNYHASAQYQSNTPKTISVPKSQIDIVRGYLAQQSETQKKDLDDAVTKLELLKAQAMHNNSIARVFGKGK